MEHRFTLRAVAILALSAVFGCLTLPAARATTPAVDGAKVGQWKTWVLASGSEIAVPAPPAENSDQTKAELDELRALQAARTPAINVVIQYYHGVPATQRWHDQMFVLMIRDKLSPNRQARILSILHTTLHDAVVAAYAAKYQHNRRPPAQVAPDLTPLVTVTSEAGPAVPSYPSEHAAIAGAAVGVLSALFPKDADALKAIAQESGQTRLQMGANYRSDIDAGYALGQAVAVKANARAAADGSDAVWTGTVPTGPGLWTGTNPLEPLQGTWKTWLLTSGSQLRPGPPPAFGSAELNAELAYMKQINSNPSPAQRAIAVDFPATALTRFWNNVYEVIRIERLSVPQETRILSTAAAVWLDSNIAAHDAKYFYWQLRPAQADPTIVPLIPTPNHPSYPSNAAILYKATAEFLSSVLPDHTARFQALAQEGAFSRIFAGIHYPSDEKASEQMGKSLAGIAVQRYQQDGP
jgi:membrane-associated phospholipid phosphatase